MKRLNEAGSHVIAVALLVLVLGLVGFTGYKVMHANDKDSTNKTATSQKATAPVQINSKADLEQASKALDSSSGDVNGSLNDGALDADMNDML